MNGKQCGCMANHTMAYCQSYCALAFLLLLLLRLLLPTAAGPKARQAERNEDHVSEWAGNEGGGMANHIIAYCHCYCYCYCYCNCDFYCDCLPQPGRRPGWPSGGLNGVEGHERNGPKAQMLDAMLPLGIKQAAPVVAFIHKHHILQYWVSCTSPFI